MQTSRNVLVCRELRPVIRGDSPGLLPEGIEQPDDLLGHRSGLPAVFELRHEDEARLPFMQHQDGVAVAVHDQVHLVVTEAGSVRLGRPLVYTRAVRDVRRLGRLAPGLAPAPEVRMASVPAQLACLISVDDVVHGLHAHRQALALQHAAYLLGRPVRLNNPAFDLRDQQRVQTAVGDGATTTIHGFPVRLPREVVPLCSGIAPQLAGKG